MAHLRRWHPFVGLSVFLVLALPWHVAASIANRAPGVARGFLAQYFFVSQGRQLFLSLRHHATAASGMWPYGLIFIAALLPWVVFAGSPGEESRERRKLLALWMLAAMVLGIIFPEQVGVLAFAPPLALLTAEWLARDEEASDERGLQVARILARLALLVVLGCAVLLRFQPHVAGLSRRAFAWLHVPPGIIALAVLVGTGMNLLLRKRGKARLANCFLAGMMVFVLLAAQGAAVAVSAVNSSRNLADAIAPELNASSAIVIHGRLEQASSFAFYLGRHVLIADGRAGELAYGASFSDGPPVFIDDAGLAKLWNGPARVFLWTEPTGAPHFDAPVYVIASSGGKVVLSNAPNAGGADF